MLEIKCLILGNLQTNTYLLVDTESKEMVIIDAADQAQHISHIIEQNGWKPCEIWITHAHFDHIGAANKLAALYAIPIALHHDDLILWRMDGGAPLFGIHFEAGNEPQNIISNGTVLSVGAYRFEVRHIPGHSSGHVVYYCAEQGLLISGDVLFKGSVGRTDLPGGNWPQLVKGIRQHILTLPDDTRVLAGHGEETTVGNEKQFNPYLSAEFI